MIDKKKRQAEWVALFRAGETHGSIASRYGVTRSAVTDSLRRFGVKSNEGGFRLSFEKSKLAKQESKKKRFLEKWGCDKDFVDQVSDLPRSNLKHPVTAYQMQKSAARIRGIAWEFNFFTWWEVWSVSGKWNERGKPGYCMARFGDLGPYSPTNVEIITQSQNTKDSFINTPYKKRKYSWNLNRRWIRFGWSAGSWQVYFGGKYVASLTVRK